MSIKWMSLNKLDGLMTARELTFLEYWALRVQQRLGYTGLACEIGSFHGRTAVLLAQFFKVWSIDLGGDLFHGSENIGAIGKIDRETLLTNLAQRNLIPDRVTPICGTSNFLSDVSVEQLFNFVFIDGDHSYEWCKRDLENISWCCNHISIIAIHDYQAGRPTCKDYGVVQAVDEFLEANKEYKILDCIDSLMIISRADWD